MRIFDSSSLVIAGVIIERLNGSSFCMSNLMVSNVISRVGFCSFFDGGWLGWALWSAIEFEATAAGEDCSVQPVANAEIRKAENRTQKAKIREALSPLSSAFCLEFTRRGGP